MTLAIDDIAGLLPSKCLIPPQNLMGLLAGYDEFNLRLIQEVAAASKARIRQLPSYTKPYWLSSAGGPAAGKSTGLLRIATKLYECFDGIAAEEWRRPGLGAVVDAFQATGAAAFVSADLRGLREVCDQHNKDTKIDEVFYTKWKDASTFLAKLDLCVAVAGRKNIIHDTTLSGDSYLKPAKSFGYYTCVVATACPPEMKEGAANKRNAEYFQSFRANLIEQDRQFNIQLPTIAADADEMHIAWRAPEDMHNRIAAFFRQGRLAIHNRENFNNFCTIYPTVRQEILLRLVEDSEVETQIPYVIMRQYSFRAAPAAAASPT